LPTLPAQKIDAKMLEALWTDLSSEGALCAYSLEVIGNNAKGLTIKPGETKDLPDLQVKLKEEAIASAEFCTFAKYPGGIAVPAAAI
jgi:hypothetical protein